MIDTTTRSVPTRSSGLMLGTLGWVLAAIGISVSGALARAPILAAVCVVGAVAGWSFAYRRSASVRAALDAIDLRVVLAFHLIRIPIGALFLVEHAHGRLAELFAYRAGYGDIAVGALALVAIALHRRRGVLLAWSIIGLADILLAVGTAQYLVLARHDPLMMEAFTRLPYPLLPTLIVPAVIATHLLVLARIRR